MFHNFVRGLHGSEWAQFLDYLSPAFFEIVPALDIAKLSAQMGKSFAKRQHDEEEQAVRGLIHTLNLPVDFRHNKSGSDRLPSLSRRERGRIVLALFFGQILAQDHAWLDLRGTTFELLSKEMIWKPLPWIIHWDTDFLDAIRDILIGLFHQDRDRFDNGLRNLQLQEVSEDLHRLLYSDQALPFSLRKFRDAVHDIFLVCKKAKIKLHPNFFPFGLYLGTLWEHMAALNESLKVGPIFDSVWQAVERDRHPELHGAQA